jgi:hypothetical protein
MDPDRVLYEEEPMRAEALRQNPIEYGTFGRILFNTYDDKPSSGWKTPAVFQFKQAQAVQKTFPLTSDYALGGVIWRTDRSGKRWLIVLKYGSTAVCSPKGHSVGIMFQAIKAGLSCTKVEHHRWTDLSLSLKKEEVLRLYAVQPDAKNPDRLTIRYEINSVAGTIDGNIGEDGLVALRVRDGPAIQHRINNGKGETVSVDGKKVKKESEKGISPIKAGSH